MNSSLPTDAAAEYERPPRNLPPEIRLRHLPGGGVVGRWLATDLGSVFQPLIRSDDGAIIGYEAFVRAHGGGEMSLSPWNLFSLVADDAALVMLDRLCRTVHVQNFRGQAGKLFLNVHDRLLAAVSEDHGRAFRRVLEALELKPAQFVIETPEAVNPDRKLLAFVLANYRLNGFAVAVNVASVIELEELLRVMRPEYVKLDGRRLCQPEQMERAIVLARDHGVRPVFTRVEGMAQLSFLQRRIGLLIQGWAVARPQALPIDVRAASLAAGRGPGAEAPTATVSG